MLRFCTIVFFFYFLLVSVSFAQIVKTYSLKHSLPHRTICAGDNALIVISGNEIPALLGQHLEQLSFFSLSNGQWRAIVFQIDQKDPQGRYIITKNDLGSSEDKEFLSSKDELVVRKIDLGERLSHSSEQFRQYSLLEIEIASEQDEPSRWFYINIGPYDTDVLASVTRTSGKTLAFDDQERDTIVSSVYKIGFSEKEPFLVDAFHWRLPQSSGWSPDISDMMKIRHAGKFFGLPFKRTHDDYHSLLVGVKKGPLRIIRRTENRVKVFWKLKTPALYIDYVMMQDGFVMDTMIDIPFKIALFFSDLETLTTMDWNPDPDLPAMTIHSVKGNLNLPVNGRQSADKKAFNKIVDRAFSMSSEMGVFDVTLDIPDDFPIKTNLYLNDALNKRDLPENYPGQFGNVGFRTTDWENIDNKLHHLKFTVCMRQEY